MCYVLGQNTLLSPCLSLHKSINRYLRIVGSLTICGGGGGGGTVGGANTRARGGGGVGAGNLTMD